MKSSWKKPEAYLHTDRAVSQVAARKNDNNSSGNSSLVKKITASRGIICSPLEIP